MGFWEWYLHTVPFRCNPNPPSTVMDLAPNAVFGCGDGSTVTSADVADVNTFYRFSTVSNAMIWDCSAYYPGNAVCVTWYDDEPANAHTYIDYWRCTTQSCANRTYLGPDWHAPGAGSYHANNSAYLNSGILSGYYYYANVYHSNAVNGVGSGVSTAVVYVP